MLAIQAPPTLCACTISTCSEAIRRPRMRALRLSLNGLTVAFTSGARSPPKAVSSPTSGPSSPASSARAPDCTSAAATLSAVRATGPSRKAGTICRTVASAKVCGGAGLSSLCTEANSLDPDRLVCRSGILVFNGGTRRNTPAASVRPKPGSPNERSLPEILECWNRSCGAQDCRPAARGRGPRPVLARRLQIGHEGHQGRGSRSMGAGPRPGDHALRLFRPRRIRRQLHRRHDRPLVRGNTRRVRCLLSRTAGCDRLVDGWVALMLTRELTHRTQPDPCAVRLVLIAPAVDFTEELMWKRFPPEVKREIEQTGVWARPSQYSEQPYLITRGLIEVGRKHLLL